MLIEKQPNKRNHSLLRRVAFVIAGATSALLSQGVVRADEGAAAWSDGARAVEDTRRSDSAAAPPSMDAALRFRMDEMRQRRDGRASRQKEKLRRLTPDERKRKIKPPPLPRPRRYRDLSDALERVNSVRRRAGLPLIGAEQ